MKKRGNINLGTQFTKNQRKMSIEWLTQRAAKHKLDKNKVAQRWCEEAIESHEEAIKQGNTRGYAEMDN